MKRFISLNSVPVLSIIDYYNDNDGNIIEHRHNSKGHAVKAVVSSIPVLHNGYTDKPVRKISQC